MPGLTAAGGGSGKALGSIIMQVRSLVHPLRYAYNHRQNWAAC